MVQPQLDPYALYIIVSRGWTTRNDTVLRYDVAYPLPNVGLQVMTYDRPDWELRGAAVDGLLEHAIVILKIGGPRPTYPITLFGLILNLQRNPPSSGTAEGERVTNALTFGGQYMAELVIQLLMPPEHIAPAQQEMYRVVEQAEREIPVGHAGCLRLQSRYCLPGGPQWGA